MGTEVVIAIQCYRCKGSGWLERDPGDSLHQLPTEWHEKTRRSNFPVPKPAWFKQPSLRAGHGKRPTHSHYPNKTLVCFECKGKGKIPKRAELYESVETKC